MDITDNNIDKLANLAKLHFNDVEKQQIKADLQNMLGFIDKMNELNTDDVEPLLHITENINIMRDDVLQGSINNEDALANAAQKNKPYFVVPKVIKTS